MTVVFPAHACHGNHEKVYSATVGSSLPRAFTDNTTSTANGTVILNVNTSEDGENGSAIMRSHIFNVTVAIRLYKGHFAVTIQSPKHLMEWRGLGLCYSAGCPTWMKPVDLVSKRNTWCKEVKSTTARACGIRSTILQGHGGSGLTYLDACRFDVVEQQDFQMAVVTKMAAEDANLLGSRKPEQSTPSCRFFCQIVHDSNNTSAGEAPPQKIEFPSTPQEDSLDRITSSPALCTVPVGMALLALTVFVLQFFVSQFFVNF